MRYQKRYLVYVLLIVTFLTGCSLFGKKEGNVVIRVVLEDGTPVSGLDLTLKSNKTTGKSTSDQEGKSKFQIDVGTYTLEGEILLYDGTKEIIKKEISIKSGDNPEIVHKIVSIGQLEISVADAVTKKPISDSKLIISTGGKENILEVGQSGKATLYAKIGTYALTAKKGELSSETLELVLASTKVAREINIENIVVFSGSIKLKDGTPLKDVTVKVGEHVTTTNAEGLFSIYTNVEKSDVLVSFLGKEELRTDVNLTQEFNFVLDKYGLVNIQITDKDNDILNVLELTIGDIVLEPLEDGTFYGLVDVGEQSRTALLNASYLKVLDNFTVESKLYSGNWKLDSVQKINDFEEFGQNYTNGTVVFEDGCFVATKVGENRFISKTSANAKFAYSFDINPMGRYMITAAHQKENSFFEGMVTLDSRAGTYALRSYTTISSVQQVETSVAQILNKWLNLLLVFEEDGSVSATITDIETGEKVIENLVLSSDKNSYKNGYLGFRLEGNGSKVKNIIIDRISD